MQRLKHTAKYQFSLLSAAYIFHGLYYLNLILYYFRHVNPLRPRSFFHSWKMMSTVYGVRRYTAVLIPRLVTLYRLSEEVNRRSIPGDIVECGVYNGGSAVVMASIGEKSPLNRKVWLFDSFEGLPKPSDKDGNEAPEYEGWCHGDLAKVREIFEKMHIPESRVHIVKGWFQDTFQKVQIPDIAILHIDADWYESVKLCLEKFYDCVRPGGYVVLDDYGSWEGCKIATNEFLKKRALDVKLVQVDFTGFYFQKPYT